MCTPIKEILKLVQKDGDFEELSSPLQEPMDVSGEELSERMMSMSIEHSNEQLEEGKHDSPPERISGCDRLFLYTPDDSLKHIIEKIVAAPDKRLVQLRKGTKEVVGVLSITDILTYVTS